MGNPQETINKQKVLHFTNNHRSRNYNKHGKSFFILKLGKQICKVKGDTGRQLLNSGKSIP